MNSSDYSQRLDHQLLINGLLCFLSIASLSFGFLFKDVFDYRFWGKAIWVDPSHNPFRENEFLNSRMKLLPVILSFLGVLLSSCLQLTATTSLNNNITSLLSNKWNTDLAINHSIVVPSLNICEWITYRVIDKGWIEIVGPSGVSIYQETTAFLQLIFNGHLFNSINIITFFATITITLINYGYKHNNDHAGNTNISDKGIKQSSILISGKPRSIKRRNIDPQRLGVLWTDFWAIHSLFLFVPAISLHWFSSRRLIRSLTGPQRSSVITLNALQGWFLLIDKCSLTYFLLAF